VKVRWGHEMEDPTGRYPWARKDAAGYKAAYRHVVIKCRERLPLAQFVWSPKGEKNLAQYYPGADVVDIVGLSIWGLQRMDQDFYARDRGLFDVLSEKYWRVSQFGKPVYIAELGFDGDKNYRKKWTSQASDIEALNAQFPLLQGLVYFNDVEPQMWPQNYGKPDWRIQADVVDRISIEQRVSIRAQALQQLASKIISSLHGQRTRQLAYLPSMTLFFLRPALT
jgi:beta-mannanase